MDWYPFQWLFRSWSWTSGGSLWFWWRGVGKFAWIFSCGATFHRPDVLHLYIQYVEGKPNINPYCECPGTSFPIAIVGFVSKIPKITTLLLPFFLRPSTSNHPPPRGSFTSGANIYKIRRPSATTGAWTIKSEISSLTLYRHPSGACKYKCQIQL